MIRVAIIEDDINIRSLLLESLNRSLKVFCSHAFKDAETALSEIPHLNLDVVLVDIGLPNQNGIECISKLKPLNTTTQFLIYTSFDDTELIFEALKAGASGYIMKTTETHLLIDAIIDIQNGGSPMSYQIARKVVNSFYQHTSLTSDFQKLSDREKEILELLDKGFRYKEIASNLFISTETVRTHIRNIYKKLQVNSRTEAINKSFRK